MILRVLDANSESTPPVGGDSAHRVVVLVLLVLLSGGVAKVIPSVVLPITVYVVNLMRWIFPFHVKAGQSVGRVLVAVNLYPPVTTGSKVSSALPRLGSSLVFPPEEVSGGGNVIKEFQETGLGAGGIWGSHMGTIA